MCACNLTWVINDYELRSSNGAKWILLCLKWPEERRTKTLHDSIQLLNPIFMNMSRVNTKYKITFKLYAKQQIFELLFVPFSASMRGSMRFS